MEEQVKLLQILVQDLSFRVTHLERKERERQRKKDKQAYVKECILKARTANGGNFLMDYQQKRLVQKESAAWEEMNKWPIHPFLLAYCAVQLLPTVREMPEEPSDYV